MKKSEVKWSKQKIIDRALAYSNEDLIYNVLYLAGGDDYDGCFTPRGEFEYEISLKELSKRLISVGFIEKELED